MSARRRGARPQRLLQGAAAGLVLLVLAVLTVAIVGEGLHEGLGDAVQDARHLASALEPRFGPGASFAGLYLEESGVPVPVAGDVMVVYLGHRFGHRLASAPLPLVAVWLGLGLTLVAGSRHL